MPKEGEEDEKEEEVEISGMAGNVAEAKQSEARVFLHNRLAASRATM